jgi:hypothetical protein
VFTQVAEVLTLAVHNSMGIQKTPNDELGLKQQSPIAAIEAADASDLGTVVTLANELKTKFDALLTLLKNAEIMPPYEGYFHRYYFHVDYFADTPTPYFAKAV